MSLTFVEIVNFLGKYCLDKGIDSQFIACLC